MDYDKAVELMNDHMYIVFQMKNGERIEGAIDDVREWGVYLTCADQTMDQACFADIVRIEY